MRIVIQGATAMLPEGARVCDVLVENGRIAAIGESAAEGGADRIVDARGDILCPGFINAHCHLPMTLFRGVADDLNLQDWLYNEIFPREDRLTGELAAIGTRAALAECLASGITSVSDMYFFSDHIAQEVAQCGIKANIARCLTGYAEGSCKQDLPAWEQMERLISDWHGYDGGRILVDVAVHAEYTTTPALWRDAAEFSACGGHILQVHLSETRSEHEAAVARYGKTPTELFAEAGFFQSRVNAAHCVWLTQSDMDVLAAHGACAIHNPCSNAKLASGIAPVDEMLSRGVHVALGTDGASSNNALSFFSEMKTACLVAKLRGLDPLSLSARRVLGLATEQGAYAQGREATCGAIRVGMDADLVLVSGRSPALMPHGDPASALVYSADTSAVRMTMVRGRVLYENGEHTTIDTERLRAELCRACRELA